MSRRAIGGLRTKDVSLVAVPHRRRRKALERASQAGADGGQESQPATTGPSAPAAAPGGGPVHMAEWRGRGKR